MPAPQVVRYKRKAGSGRGTKKQRERAIQVAYTKWLIDEYPDVVFYNDWASGAFLTAGQNTQRMQLACPHKWVDTFIAEPRRGFHGLFLEIKKEDVKIYRKDGELVADAQIRQEAAFLTHMNSKGYCGRFAVGLEKLKKVTDWYMGTIRPEQEQLF